VDSVRVGQASLLSPGGAAWLGFAYTMALGALPALFVGAPAYALLAQAGRASWSTAMLVGMVPGLLALLFETWLGVWALGCGVAVAGATHLFVQRWTRRSNSTPHSDARASDVLQQPPSARAGERGR
jgi:endonuclease/exonuclease/phosphatase (EEP) superfamily protein YafD